MKQESKHAMQILWRKVNEQQIEDGAWRAITVTLIWDKSPSQARNVLWAALNCRHTVCYKLYVGYYSPVETLCCLMSSPYFTFFLCSAIYFHPELYRGRVNIATGEKSWAITLFHFLDNFHFFCMFKSSSKHIKGRSWPSVGQVPTKVLGSRVPQVFGSGRGSQKFRGILFDGFPLKKL